MLFRGHDGNPLRNELDSCDQAAVVADTAKATAKEPSFRSFPWPLPLPKTPVEVFDPRNITLLCEYSTSILPKAPRETIRST